MELNDNFDQLLKDHLQRTTQTNRPVRKGLDQVKKRIALDRESSKENSFVRKFTTWLGLDSPRMGFALSVIAVQFVALGGLSAYHFSNNSSVSEMRSIASKSSVTKEMSFFRIAFKAPVTEAQIRELLISINGDIVAGPSQLGEYYVLTANGDTEAELTKIKGSSFVDNVKIVKKLP